MSFLSKDVQEFILDKLLLPEIIRWHQAWPNSPLLTNDLYWKNRLRRVLYNQGLLLENFDFTFQVYFQTEKSLNIEDAIPDEALMQFAGRWGSPDVFKIVSENGYDNEGFCGAVWANNKTMVNFLLELGANDWNGGLQSAIMTDDIYWVEKMISYGANVTDLDFYQAIFSRRFNICKFFIENSERIGWEYRPERHLQKFWDTALWLKSLGENMYEPIELIIEWINQREDFAVITKIPNIKSRIH